MSSPAFDAPLTLEPRPSPALRAALLLVHGLAMGGLLLLPAAWLAVGLPTLGVSLAYEWHRAGRGQRLHWRGDGSWEQPGAATACQLHHSTFISRWLIVLVLDDGRRLRHWLLCADAVPAPTWRRLRARLRVHGPALVGAEQDSVGR